jgi:CRISPR/Cas system-associated protein Cas10 (large subunit of type III CRISPR-Cas system)
VNLDEFLDCIEKEESEYSLLLGDVDRIHEYIFETSNLAEVRGGSRLITSLITNEFESIFGNYFNDMTTDEKEFRKNGNNGFRIYNNAGSCMAIVPTHKIDEFITAINDKFCQETDVVTITFVHMPMINLNGDLPSPAGEISKWIVDSNRDFRGHQGLIRFLKSRETIEKKKKSFFPFIESNPIVRRCGSCGKRPAIAKSQHTPSFLCSVCYKKDQKRDRSLPIEELAEECSALKDIDLPKDLDELAGTSSYIALLYADGNEMGRTLFSSENLIKFKNISQNIEKILRESTIHSLGPILKDDHEKLPLEILNMAGDDILLIIQGRYVLDFSLSLLEAFERMCEERLDISATMSLGLTLFRPTYPIQYIFHTTNSLLRQAKRSAKERGESALSYLRLKAPISVYSSEEVLNRYYVSRDTWLTMRPYTLKEFGKLRKTAEEIRRDRLLPPSQREAILLSFGRTSLKATMNFIKYQIGKMKNGKSLLEKIENLRDTFELRDLDGKEELPIWGKRRIDGQEVSATPFLDILELLDMEGGTRA